MTSEPEAHSCVVGIIVGAWKRRGHINAVGGRGGSGGGEKAPSLVLEGWVVFPGLDKEVGIGGI